MSENPPRFDWDEFGSILALALTSRASCLRAAVACVILDKKGNVVSSGYNGSRRGELHCRDAGVGCDIIDGHCVRTIHDAINALNRAEEIGRYHELKDNCRFYSTHRPCNSSGCFDNLVAAGIKYICFMVDYRSEEIKEYQERICKERNIILKQFKYDNPVPLMQRLIDFHQGPGGLLIARNRLTIEEHIPEMMDH